jgi:hypothetical protein
MNEGKIMNTKQPENTAGTTNEKSYTHAKDFHTIEINTLNQRTNFFLVTQSIIIGGLTIAFSGSFGYIVPLILSLLVIVGESFCYLHYNSGHIVAENTIRWRLYMKHLEINNTNEPWNWFYNNYEKKYKDPKKNLLNKLPLSYMWLWYPLLFSFVWLIVSSYAPGRMAFDSTFVVDFGVKILCWIVSGIACAVSITIFIVICKMGYKWQHEIIPSE